MLFNSIEFAFFLPIVFVIYWFVTNKELRIQNLLLLFASYLFYGWWDWRFLSLLLFSTVVDFTIAIYLEKTTKISVRKLLLYLSLAVNLGFLGFFKYFNFFAESFANAFTLLGTSISPTRLNIILPVGISFYTFQTLSYTIDVYRRKLKPTRNFIAFGTFVSFFPQLVAGPIERASNLLPQFLKKRDFKYDSAVSGTKQILWGLFKKIVIADNCARHVNEIFNNSSEYSGSALFIGALLFAFQIYGDFSGYSDIAIGTSRLFGFNLKQNFAFPYFSRDIAEFWRRWHISLSTWFRDYVYIPLGGSKGGAWMKVRNTFIIFIVSGFWHGANWTFILWGFLNALYFLPLLLMNNNRNNIDIVSVNKVFPSFKEIVQMSLTFILVVFSWIFFRSESLAQAFTIISKIVSMSFFEIPRSGTLFIPTLQLLVLFVSIEWFGRKGKFGIDTIMLKFPLLIRWSFYYALIILILLNITKPTEFIYFQF